MTSPLRDVIQGIRGREGMYVRPVDWNNIVSFIHGFNEGMKASGVPDEFGAFESWLERKIGFKSASGWTWIVENKFADGDANKAIVAFYELWDEYLSQVKSS